MLLIELSAIHIVYRPMVTSTIKEQSNTSIEEQIRTIPKFGGPINEDVIHWLQAVDEVFDRFQLQPSNRYILRVRVRVRWY